MAATKRCPAKKRYSDELGAKIALASTIGKRGKRRNETRYYKCPVCRGWHLTSQPAKDGTKNLSVGS